MLNLFGGFQEAVARPALSRIVSGEHRRTKSSSIGTKRVSLQLTPVVSFGRVKMKLLSISSKVVAVAFAYMNCRLNVLQRKLCYFGMVVA